MFKRFLANYIFSEEYPLFIAPVVNGNWTCKSKNDFKVLYFINLGFKKYQTLLNDRFLDINVTNKNELSAGWNGYNFSMHFYNFSTKFYFGFSKINNEIDLNIQLFSKISAEIVFIKRESREVTSYFCTKYHAPEFGISDLLSVILLSSLMIYTISKIIKSVKKYKNNPK